jgi:hypothetical protein
MAFGRAVALLQQVHYRGMRPPDLETVAAQGGEGGIKRAKQKPENSETPIFFVSLRFFGIFMVLD